MAVQSNAPVIIKRKKVVAGDGHHGGAWKVAMSASPFHGGALLRREFNGHSGRRNRRSDGSQVRPDNPFRM
jgi:hypothetical protein